MDVLITENSVFAVRSVVAPFVANPSRQPISQETRDLIDKLLKERLSRFSDAFHARSSTYARVTEVSERWLQNYVNQKYYLTPKEAKVTQKASA